MVAEKIVARNVLGQEEFLHSSPVGVFSQNLQELCTSQGSSLPSQHSWITITACPECSCGLEGPVQGPYGSHNWYNS